MADPSLRVGSEGILLSFFYRLRSHGLKVTPHQWLDLLRGLSLGLHGSSMMGFYSLARGLMVKDESELDSFDLCFAAHFAGGETDVAAIEKAVWEWLDSPSRTVDLDPKWREFLEKVDLEALREQFEQRLRDQTERHDGGNRWIGTGGTSAFGHSGAHPGGLRVGGAPGAGTAVQVAAARRFKEYRRDQVLDTRQLSVALKKLRTLDRRGPADELDLEGTIDRTAREAGELAIVLRPPRQNRLALLLMMDVGGSMWPHRHLVDTLFSAAHHARHFKHFGHAYFHNCIYERVWADAQFSEAVPLPDLFKRHDRETRLVLVGDASMYPGELTDRFGAIDWTERNPRPGLDYLERVRDHFRHCAWLNPLEPRFWSAPSIRLIRKVFPMYPLTVEGVEELARDLSSGSPH